MTDSVTPGQPSFLQDDTGMFNVQVAPRVTHEQRAAEKAAAEERLKQQEEAHSWWDVTKSAVKMNQVIPMVIEQFATPPGGDDETPLTDEKLKELTEGIDTAYFDEFDGNETVGEALRTRTRILEQLKAQEILMSKGAAPGIAMSIAAGLTDPVAIAASVASGGLLAPVMYGAKATRLSRAVQAGLVGAASAAPIEAYMASRDVTYDAQDAILGIVAGGVISGAVGYKWPGKLPDVEQYTQRALNQEYVGEFERAGARHTPATDLLLPNSGNPDGTIKSAAQRNAEWFTDLERNAASTSMKGARLDRSAFVHGSETEEVRKMGHALFDDPNAELGSLQRETAAMFTINQTDDVIRRAALNQREAYQEFKQAMKAQRGDFSEDAFETEVWRVLNGRKSNIPGVNKMAEFYRKEFEKVAEMANNPGKGVPVKGAENMTIKDYAPRRYSTSKIAAAVATEGRAKVAARLAAAIRGYPPNQAQSIAEHIIDVVSRTKAGHIDLRFAEKNLETMTSYFMRDLGMGFKDANAAAQKLKRLTEGLDAGNAGNLKFRLDLDDLAVEDLLDTNASNLFNSYARTMYGHIGLARQGIDSEDTFNALLDVTRQKRMANIKGKTDSWKADAELRYLQDAYDFIVGRAVGEDPGSFGATAGRLARKYNYARVMNVQAISALGDLGQVLSQVGLKAAIQHIPEMLAIHRRIRNGQFIDELSEETAQLTGWLNRSAVAKARQRFEDFAAGGEVKETNWSKVERAADTVGRVTGHISGINALQDMTQRLAGKAMIQTFLDAARTGKPHRLGEARLRELGVSEELMSRIKTEMMKKGNASWDSLGRIKKLNIDNWDYETRLQFGMVLRRWGAYLVQEQHFGSLPGFMDTTGGKLLTQFRSFQSGAWVKQTLFNVKHHDRIATQAFVWSILTGALSFYASVQAGRLLLADDKADEYMEKRLGPDSGGEVDWSHVAKQSFMRAGISSFLPGIVDSTVGAIGEDPVFGQRNSGLAQGFIGGNPTLDTLTKLGDAFTATAQAIKQGEATKDMVDAWHSAVIWQNALGVRNGLYHLTKDMPEFLDDED